ncbi:MAG TPA: response regulator, partial [Polyangiaceae bacterium]|nr:response regulator [Polyangiaceae bacterium]
EGDAAARAAGDAAARAAGDARRARPLAGRRWRVLLADDNADMREYVERLLREYWDVEAVADGAAALASALRSPPDLVLSDVMMPGLDGFALLAALRADERTAAVPVLLLSARAGEEAALEGFAAGAADYLVKPFSSRELVARVATHLALGRARRAERDAQRRLRALFLQAPVAVSVLRGPDFTVELTNARYDEMVGRAVPAGAPFRDAFPELPDDAPVFQMLRRVRESGEAFSASEYCVPLARGGRPPADAFFQFTSQPLREGGGEVDTILTVAIEVTEQVELRRRLERLAEAERGARREAEEASRLKDEFLATLSHELRTPLTAVVGWVQLLRAPRRSHDPWVAKALEVIDRNLKTQTQIIDDLLDVSRVVTGKLNLEPEPFALDGVVREAAEIVQHAADAKRVRLSVDAEPSPFVGDPARLRQVCWNLLANAVRYTPPGGAIRVTLGRADGHFVLEVADTGLGIAPDFLPHVWERFRQADGSSTRKFGGLGLGLSIVRHVVELHGGSVEVESAGAGRGTTFRAHLPAAVEPPAPASDPPPRAVEAAPPPPGADRSLEGRQILLVEDEDDSRELFVTILTVAGAEVRACTSGAEALAALVDARPDLLLFDIGLPELDGRSLLLKARADFPHLRDVPAVALTAYARPEDVERALAAGFAAHLAKPLNPDVLVQKLREVLDRRS